MKRILYFQHVSKLGGSGLSLLKIIRSLDKTEFLPSVVLREEGPLVELLEQEGAEIHFDRKFYMFGYCSGFQPEWWELGFYRALLRFPVSLWTGYRWARKLRPDIVHVNSLALMGCGIGAKLADVKTVLHVREYSLRGRFGVRNRCISLLANRFFDRAIAICKAYSASNGIDDTRCEIVYNWVAWDKDIGFDSKPLREELGLSYEQCVILFLGGESSVKGTHVLLSAVSKLDKNTPAALILGGAQTGTKRKRSRKYLELLNFYEEQTEIPIIKTGVIKEVGYYLSLCDFLVFPSTVPHFANPVIEAAWLGKPCIMSDDIVGRELIDENVTGLLCKPNDSDTLAEKILCLIYNPDICRQMGKNAKEYAQERYAKSNIGKIEVIYEQL